VLENGIGTWDQSFPSSENQLYTIWHVGRRDEPAGYPANVKVLGTIAYVQNGDNFGAGNLYWNLSKSNIEWDNNAAYLGTSFGGKNTFELQSCSECQNRIAHNLTSIGGGGIDLQAKVQTSNVVQGSSISQTGDIYTDPRGARICKRYRDGQLTNEPLWPWPMNQRIIDAMRQAGRQPVDVTATIEKLFGPIPAECRSSGGGPPVSGPCHSLDAAQPVPAGYGAAYNVHSLQKELLITARCEADRTDTELGSGNALTYVYHSGWYWNGGRWVQQSYACEGEKVANAWCAGKAKGVVPAGAAWFVGYTCFWNGSAWKCGCRDAACSQSYWQLQGVNR
jgi:hypothetical protein